jgi:hypothetical protein
MRASEPRFVFSWIFLLVFLLVVVGLSVDSKQANNQIVLT